jgi:polycystin 1L2
MCCKSQTPNEYKQNDLEEERNKKAGRIFPFWFAYIGWILVLASILVPAFFVILYSMQWGKDRSNAWLVSMLLSFFQSLFVIDPLKVFLITAVIICILRKLDEDNDLLIDSGDPIYNAIVNKDEEYLTKTVSNLSELEIEEIMRARKAKLSKLEPVDPELLDVQRKNRVKQVRMKQILLEGASYLGFLVVLLFICHQSRSRNTNMIHKDMTNLFLNNPIMAFDDVIEIFLIILYNCYYF